MNAQSVGHIFWAIKRTALYVGRGETHLANPYNQVTGHSNGISFHDYKRVICCLRNIYSNYSSLLWIKSGRQYYCSQENSRKMVPSGRPFWGGRICSGELWVCTNHLRIHRCSQVSTWNYCIAYSLAGDDIQLVFYY